MHDSDHAIKGNKKMITKDKKKKRNRRTRCENKHKLLTQDVQTQDVNRSKLPTVVPATTSKTHGLKLVSSTNYKDHGKGALLRFAVQNCNGLRREGYKCRLANSMDAANIDACCLTETHLVTAQSERWDTGHTSLTSGVFQRRRAPLGGSPTHLAGSVTFLPSHCRPPPHP
jgi:hypothetical protein